MFINHIYRHARENPEHLAVVNSGEEITYRRFATDIEVVRNFLMRARLPREGVIVNITSNLYLDWVLLFAVRSLGHTTVSGTSWKVIESLYLGNISGLVCLSDQLEAMDAFRNAKPECAIVNVHREMIFGDSKSPPPPPVEHGRFGDHVVYTSGTTGTYKKLLVRGDMLEQVIEKERYGLTGQFLTRDDVFFAYNFGPWTALGSRTPPRCWFRGATVIFDQRTDWAERFFDFPVTMTSFVPALLDEVSKRIKPRPSDFPTLHVQVGGG